MLGNLWYREAPRSRFLGYGWGGGGLARVPLPSGARPKSQGRGLLGSLAPTVGRSFGRSVAQSVGRSVGRSVGLSVRRSVARVPCVYRVAGRSLGRWVGRSFDRSVGRENILIN